ncbi:RHS repeat-associated core domain-containing protein [Entomohabitans teleogrylli]|uniref:RHS repeat-associated core domain-containing protein n=1 Tax=Entomohabitans teleogrylli TaxID=1384589 RepID=UPI00073D1B2D|nr:RHS repeat-associated core domain-containing protein [Entomohabitans teleogrylli]
MSVGKGIAAIGALAGASMLNRTAGLVQAKMERDATFQNFKAARAGWEPGPGGARFGDPVKHKSFWAALAGAVVGAVLTIAAGVVIIAAFSLTFPVGLLVGGLALYAAVKAAPAIEKISNKVTSFVDDLFTSPDGMIITGSPNVFVNKLFAARAGVTLPASDVEVVEAAPTDLQNLVIDFSEGNYLKATSSLPGAVMEGAGNVMDWAGDVSQKNMDTVLGRNDASVLERLEAASCWLTGGPIAAELLTMAGGHGAIKRDVNFPVAPGDTACCKESKPPRIAQGSGSVFINSQPAARKGDKLECSAAIKAGAKNVLIGGGQLTYLDIDAEFPPWMRKILGAINIASFLLPPSSIGAKLAGRLSMVAGKLAGRLPRVLRGAMAGAQRALVAVRGAAARVASKAADMARRAGQGARNAAGRIKRYLFDPIDAATGAYVEARTDLILGQTLALEFTRYYNSTESFVGLTGMGWSDNWSDYALVSANGNFVDIFDYTGQVYHFNFMPDDDLSWNPDYDHLTLRRRGKVLELFDADTLTSRYFYDAFNQQNSTEKRRFYLGTISDVHNNKIYFERNDAAQIIGVVHTDGIRLKLDYHSNGYLHKIIRYNGTLEVLAQYHQDERGRLTEADATQEYHLFYDYDAANRLVKWGDHDKTWVQFIYDDQGRCVATQGAEGFYCGTLSYGENFTDAIDSNGCRTRYWRDERYNIIATENQAGHVTRFTYDENHNITSRTTPQGRQTFYEYAPHSQRLSKYTDEAGNAWCYEYNHQGRLSKIVDPLGHEWQQTYNRLGRPVHIFSPTGEKTELYYHPDGLLAGIIHPDNSSRRYLYDAHKRVNQITDEAGRSWQLEYNRRDQPETVIQPGQIRTHLHWQQHGRLSQVDYADRTTASYRYDRHGNLVCHTDGNGVEWKLEYGAFDLPVARTDAQGNRWRYRYDPVTMQLAETVSPQGESYCYRFNQYGQVVEEEDYGGAVWYYEYDEDGHCISRTSGLGQKITYDYDARGLCTAEHSAEGTIRYRYSKTGQLLATESHDECISYEYDDAQRLVSEKHATHEIIWRYPSYRSVEREIRLHGDSGGRVLQTTRQYNAAGELTELKLPGGAALNLAYDGAGREAQRSADGGFMLCQYYDEVGRPVRQRAGRQPTLLLDAQQEKDIPAPVLASQDRLYHYDARGSLVAVNDDDGQVRYQLNGNGQVTAVSWPLHHEEYEYDESGYLTRLHIPGQGRSEVENRYGAGHRLAQQGKEWFEYDSSGRMTKRIIREEGFRPQIYEYQWNSRDQLTGFKKPGGETWHYRYDVMGRRTAKWSDHRKQRTEYLWDGDTVAVIREYRDGELQHIRHQVFNGFHLLAQQDWRTEGNAVGEWQTHYATTDLNGLPLALYTPEGKRVWRRRQTSLWGLSQGRMRHLGEDRLDPGLLFAGQSEDRESGLVYNRFRYYHPESGSYLSPDPLGLQGGEQTYRYVPNPLEYVDPMGLAPCPERFARYMQFRKQGYSALDAAKLSRTMGSWGDYFAKLSGTNAPINMIRAHAHHIVFQKGPAAARKFIEDSQRILREAGIDPKYGIENLVWAPNKNHTIAAAQKVNEVLRETVASGGSVRDALTKLGEMFANGTI